MTIFTVDNKPLSKRLEDEINEDDLAKTLEDFITGLKKNYSEQKLTAANIHEIFLKDYSKYNLGLLKLMRKLRNTGNFPRSKVFFIKNKSVRLYHIR